MTLRSHCAAIAVATLVAACSSFDEDAPATAEGGIVPPTNPPVADASASDATARVDAAPSAAPVLLTTVTGQLGGFAAGAAGIAWTIDDTVHAMAPGQGPVEIYASPNPLSGFLVVSATHAYFTRDDGAIGCAFGKACGSGQATLGLSKPGAIALNGGSLYVAERDGQRRLLSCSASGCGNLAPVVATLLTDPRWLAPAVSRIAVGYGSGLVVAHSPGGAPAPDSLADAKGLTGLVNDGVDAYWLEATTGRLVRRALLAKSAATELKVGLSAPRDLVLEGNALYWLETTTGSVHRCTTPACADATTITQLAGATRFALGDRVYLANDATGGIHAAPRP